MFNQRKSFLKGKLFYIILLALFGFGIWLNQSPVDQKPSDEVRTGTNYPVTTDDSVKKGASENYDIMDNIVGNGSQVSPESVDTEVHDTVPGETVNTGYYLVKEVNGAIKVFYYDEEGKESLIRETDIAFSLLSVADQELFQKGVIKHTAEELDELLQDFES